MLIATTDQVAALAEQVARYDRVAVDTEADSMHCYFEKLCLIQVSVPGADMLVDPLAPGIELAPLFRAFETREIVLQGADYDLRLMGRVGMRAPAAVFDTMIAARLLGIQEFSLAALIKRFFEVELPKGSQKANWAKRPLTPQMEDYARNDTHYLLELARILEAGLRDANRWEWFQQSCERAIEQAQQQREKDPENAWRITGGRNLVGREAAILRGLWQWRDEEARRADRPTFHILSNEKLLEATRQIHHGEEVTLPVRMNPGRVRRFHRAAATAAGLPEEEWPRKVRGGGRPRLTPEQEALVKELKHKRDAVATELKIDSSLIAPRAVIEGLVQAREEVLSTLMPWQQELLQQAGI